MITYSITQITQRYSKRTGSITKKHRMYSGLTQEELNTVLSEEFKGIVFREQEPNLLSATVPGSVFPITYHIKRYGVSTPKKLYTWYGRGQGIYSRASITVVAHSKAEAKRIIDTCCTCRIGNKELDDFYQKWESGPEEVYPSIKIHSTAHGAILYHKVFREGFKKAK